MNSEYVQIGLGLLSIVCAVLGWFARQLWTAVSELKTDLAKLREEIPQKYASTARMDAVLERIDAKLDRLFDRIDAKADK